METEARGLGVTVEDLKAWRPETAKAAPQRKRTARAVATEGTATEKRGNGTPTAKSDSAAGVAAGARKRGRPKKVAITDEGET